MKIQYLKTLLDGNTATKKGAIVETDDYKARELIALGYAVHIPEVEKSIAAPLVATPGNPIQARPIGGRGGLAKPASLSQAGQAPRKRKSIKRAASAG